MSNRRTTDKSLLERRQPFSESLMPIAARRAKLLRMPADDCEEVAAQFACDMLQRQTKWPQCGNNQNRFEAWLLRCADHFIVDWLRQRARQREREIAWPEHRNVENEEGENEPYDCAGSEPQNDMALIQAEHYECIWKAARRLLPASQHILSRYFLHGGHAYRTGKANQQDAGRYRQNSQARLCQHSRHSGAAGHHAAGCSGMAGVN